jgi:type II secretory pathway component PulL
MSRKVLGIDIRKQSVAAVLVKTSLRENRIDAYAHIPILAAEEDENGISAALEALTREMDITGCDCVVSIPADHFSYRSLKIPFKDPKKIRLVLPFELEPTVPYPVDNLVLDFMRLDSTSQNDSTEIVAVAVQKARLYPYIEALAAIKIDPEMVTVSGLPAVLILASQADPGEDRLFLDINPVSATLFIVAGGEIRMVRSFPLTTDAAIRTKSLCASLQRTLAAFDELYNSEFQPLEITVSGGGSDGLNTTSDGFRTLNLPVKQLNLADRLGIPIEHESLVAWNPAVMDNALALALAEIEGIAGLNFHKSQFYAKKFWLKHKSDLIRSGILAAAVLALLLFNFVIESYTLNQQLQRIDRQLTDIFKATFPEVTRIQDPFKQMQVNVQEAKKNALFQTDTASHVRSIDILNGLSQSIPQSIMIDITRLVVSPENVLISGNTDTFNSVDDIKGKLEQIDFFKKVTISSANTDRSGNEVRFQLKAEF